MRYAYIINNSPVDSVSHKVMGSKHDQVEVTEKLGGRGDPYSPPWKKSRYGDEGGIITSL